MQKRESIHMVEYVSRFAVYLTHSRVIYAFMQLNYLKHF